MLPLPLYHGLPAALASVSSELQRTFGGELTDYLHSLQRSKRRSGAKIINDPVWRTIRLDPWEVTVLDSPVLQRLRRIRQLGLAGYIFPGANYSRFEHSIGVLHQAQRVLEAIKRNARSVAAQTGLPEDRPVTAGDEVLLRLTALTHDVGHCFMSHVSERALKKFSTVGGRYSVREIQAEAKTFFRVPPSNAAPEFAEIISGLIILLPEWINLLQFASIPHWPDRLNLGFTMAQLMCGGRDAKRPFISEIISGPLDVDKLDYIPRDCYMAGVPMPIDVDRLMEKIQVVTVPATSLPEYSEECSIAPQENIQVLAVQAAGSRAFEELVVSRFLLYEKLYYHQKVRALEGTVVNALEILQREHPDFGKLSTYLRLSDEEFLVGRWPPCSASSQGLELAEELVGSILRRSTFIRSYAFGPGLVKNLDPDSAEFRRSWKSLEPKVSSGRERAWYDFRLDIATRARQLLQAVGQAGLARSLQPDHILVDLPPVQGIAEKTKFFVGDDQFGVEPFIKRFRVERWAEAYETAHTVGFVYTFPEFAMAVHFSVRDLVWEQHKLSFEDASWALTKLNSAELVEFSNQLAQKNPDHVRFQEPIFVLDRRTFSRRNERKLEIINRHEPLLRTVSERCKTFESHNGTTVTFDRVQSWLLQFELEDIAGAITILSAIRFWGRSALSDALASSIGELQLSNFQAVGLGSATSSAHHLTYLWDDVRGKVQASFSVVSSTSGIIPDTPIVIYDDNVGSGGQAGTVFSQWFGLKNDDSDIDEEHCEPLPENSLAILKEAPIFLIFATGFRRGLERIERRLRTLTGNSRVKGLILDPADLNCFQPAARVFPGPVEAERARSAFQRAGLSAIHDRATERNWSPQKMAERILGYGNAGGLTVFYYNVPTTTLTALWSSSHSDAANWTALFPRRPRDW